MLSNILGHEGPEELIGKSFWGLIYPDDRGLVRLSTGREQAQGFQEYSRRPLFLVDDILYWHHLSQGEAYQMLPELPPAG
jgi:hypothetical protein